MAEKKNTATYVRELIEPTVKDLGYEIWDVDYAKVGTEHHLEITIDSEKGVDLQDCEKVHRAIDPIIDEKDPIEDFYYLDVSSPGLERIIRTPYHYKKCEGETVELKLFAAFEGKKNIVGTLVSYDETNDEVTVKDKNSKEYKLQRKQISKANIYFEL